MKKGAILNGVELTELVRFSDENGRYWKNKLWRIWMQGSSSDVAPELWALRNRLGPSWLHRFNLRKTCHEFACE